MTQRRRVLTLLAAMIPAAVVLALPLPVGLAERRVLAISVFMVAGWLLEPIHPAFIGLLGCTLFWSAMGLHFEVAFHGFLTPTPWYIYGAIILGVMADDTAVTHRIGHWLPRSIAGSRAAAALAFIALGYLLGLVVPSPPATTFIVVLVALGLLRRLEARRAGPSRLRVKLRRTAIASAEAAGPAGRLDATPEPHGHEMLILGAGYAAALFGRSMTVGLDVTVARLPWDMAAAAACWFAIVRRSRRAAEPTADAFHLPPVTPVIGTAGFRVALLVGITTVAWLTVPVHGISPAIVGLAMGLVATVPGIGATATERATKPDPLAVIVVGSALSMSWVLAETGAVEVIRSTCVWFAGAAASWIPGKLAFYLAAIGHHLFVPPSASEDITWVAALAAASGVKGGGAVLWSAAGSVIFAVYQSPALVLAATLGGFSSRQVWRFGVAVALAGAVGVLFIRG